MKGDRKARRRTMRPTIYRQFAGFSLLTVRYLLFAFCLLFLSSCTHGIPRFGTGGRYEEGKDQFLMGRGGDMNRAIVALESVVKENPTYRDGLTLLGRAYYRRGRYEDARQIVSRAVAVNKDDEIAWLVLSMAMLRLGDNEKGLETLKGAITLLSKVSVNGYRDYPDWDRNGLVRSSIRTTVHLATKGLEEKENLLRAAETLLTRLDEEENFQRMELPREKRREHGAG